MGRRPGNRTNCIDCNIELDELTSVLKGDGDRKNSRCRDCWNRYQREWRSNNKDKARSIYLKYAYGITLEEYETLMKLQDGKCAICGNEDRQNLSVDHNHVTGQVRGLLCQGCNAFIGLIKENLETLEKVRNYLLKYQDLEVKNASEE